MVAYISLLPAQSQHVLRSLKKEWEGIKSYIQIVTLNWLSTRYFSLWKTVDNYACCLEDCSCIYNNS